MKKIEKLNKIYQKYKPFDASRNAEVDVWARIIELSYDEISDTSVCIFEMFTDSMVEIDRNHFKLNINSREKYRHVGYYFIGEDEGIKYQDFSNYKEIQEANGDVFFRAKLTNSVSENAYGTINGTTCFETAEVLEKDKNDFPLYQEASLTLDLKCFSDVYKDTHPASQNILINEFNVDYDSIKSLVDKKPENEIDVIYKSNIHIVSKIYRVGSASTITIDHSNGLKLMFDCGGHYKKDYTVDGKVVKKIVNYNPHVLVISHWHMDHWLYLRKIKTDNLKYLILGDKVPQDKIDLIRDLKDKKNVTVIEWDNNCDETLLERMGFENLHIYKGTNKGRVNKKDYLDPQKYSCMPENDSALIITFDGQGFKDTVIFPSDVSYASWPDEVKNLVPKLTGIVAPHHGGGVYIDNTITSVKPNIDVRVVVCNTDKYDPITDIFSKYNRTTHKTFLKKITNIKNERDFMYVATFPRNQIYKCSYVQMFAFEY